MFLKWSKNDLENRPNGKEMIKWILAKFFEKNKTNIHEKSYKKVVTVLELRPSHTIIEIPSADKSYLTRIIHVMGRD